MTVLVPCQRSLALTVMSPNHEVWTLPDRLIQRSGRLINRMNCLINLCTYDTDDSSVWAPFILISSYALAHSATLKVNSICIFWWKFKIMKLQFTLTKNISATLTNANKHLYSGKFVFSYFLEYLLQSYESIYIYWKWYRRNIICNVVRGLRSPN